MSESEYEVRLDPELVDFAADLEDRKDRMFREELQKIAEDPHPSSETRSWMAVGPAEKPWYRYKIGRSWFVYYVVDEAAGVIRIADVLPYDDVLDRGLFYEDDTLR